MEIEFVGEDGRSVPSVRSLLDSYPKDVALSDFLAGLRGELLQNGYMVGDIHVDSRKYDLELEQSLGQDPVERFEAIKVDVAPATAFIGETFAECIGASQRLFELKDEITDSVRSGQMAKVSDDLAEFTDGLAVITNAYQDGLQILARIGLARVEEVEDGQRKLSSLIDFLNEVLDGINLQDFVLVSDALEYELPDYLQKLTEDFQSWSTRLLDSVESSEEYARQTGLVSENEP